LCHSWTLRKDFCKSANIRRFSLNTAKSSLQLTLATKLFRPLQKDTVLVARIAEWLYTFERMIYDTILSGMEATCAAHWWFLAWQAYFSFSQLKKSKLWQLSTRAKVPASMANPPSPTCGV
jgi:hypothetical protein